MPPLRYIHSLIVFCLPISELHMSNLPTIEATNADPFECLKCFVEETEKLQLKQIQSAKYEYV